MPPRKRPHEDFDSDIEEELIEVQQASSALANGSATKRARVSIDDRDPSRAPTTFEDDDSTSEDDSILDAPRQQSPPRTQYEAMRDNGFEHLNHQEDDDLQATQALARRSANLQVGDNAMAESGIIESITCYNFMCHERLHVELGPLINFIVGENGSGKSAVLTAITLCLGGKASDTNRGGSLKSFVKEGQDHGSLVVKLKNCGSDAYQPDLYGDSIHIERHFSKTGSSGFKIKSALGKIISTKKQEVDEISEWFALQISNPLTVLSQDNARQFLNSASPAQKYKYFITGVQLEQLDNDYKMSQDTLDKTLIVRDDLSDNIVAVKKEMDEAERLSKTVEANTHLREKIAYYRYQLAWIQVEAKEQKHAEAVKSVQELDQRLAELDVQKQKTTETLQAYDDKINEAREAHEAMKEEGAMITEKVNAAQHEYDSKKADLTSIHGEEREAHSDLQGAMKTMKAIAADIEKEEQRLAESSGAAQAAKNAELNDATERQRSVDARLADTTNRISATQAGLGDLQTRLREAETAKATKHKEVVEAQAHVDKLKAKTGGRFDGYLPEMKRLIEAVEREASSFSQKPIGPLGAHIRLLKPEWSPVLEKSLGNNLNAFVVRSKADQVKLSALIRRCNLQRPPPIWIAYGGHIDTRSQEPDEQYDTVLRVLEFDDDLVRSQLVINNSIERLILIPERTEAQRVMFDSDQPPRNVTACFCFHDGQNKHGWGLTLSSKGRGKNSSTVPIEPYKGRLPRMQSDAAEQIRIGEDNVKQLGREMVTVSAEERSARQALSKANTEVEQNKQLVKRLQTENRHALAEVERIKTELDSFEGSDNRLLSLQNDLEDQRKEIDKKKSTYGHLGASKKEMQKAAAEKSSKLREVKDEAEEFEHRLNKASAKVAEYGDKRHLALLSKNTAHEDFDQHTIARTNAERNRVEAAAVVEQFLHDARAVAPDRVSIPEGETMDSIKVKWGKLKQQLEQRSKRIGATDEEIFARARETRKRYNDVSQEAKDVDETILELKRALEHRLELWRHFQRQISARVRIQFAYLLSERAFRGKITFDHRKRQVHLHVEPDETKQGSTGRSTKTLSGGEKSFSSICMLLSVWEAIGSPIRCLDEFDVFMDSVNRDISTRMLVDVARRSVSRQYLLITPNAVTSDVKDYKDVQVHRLTDPRQQTLI